jgi:eukaryotic-like serine/threonine-protein kinase
MAVQREFSFMPRFDAERSVLSGTLAFQIGLIDQNALESSLRAWADDKGKTLAQILVDQGALDDESKSLVEALASKQLGIHGGNLEKSLDAMTVGSKAREILTRVGDPELTITQAQVDSNATRDSSDAPTDSAAAASARPERFRVVRPHARGGLGAVFVALDTELNREVALKQILNRHADDQSSRARFLLEAEITGGLEHPGIVPVYGMGIYENGRPYYAMRFIRGESLQEAIGRFHARSAETKLGQRTERGERREGFQESDRSAAVRSDDSKGSRDLELRKLLRRFLDVCNAIDYAHSRGVLHRDIKPANIILGKHGETLVVDWGLAKATGKGDASAGEQTMTPSSASGSAETLPGSAMGTPAYMSPEQARGEIDQLSSRSDVYSLGATLYCLLTGSPPIQKESLESNLRAVQKGDFPQPRQLSPGIDRKLEAVCLKAMALEPGDRYASPRALADDIERWMADDPVTALADRWAQRVARWSRRHRSATRAAAASLIVIATVATLAALAIGREQSQTRNALFAEKLARQSESKARELAQEQSQLALDAIREYNTGVTRDFLLKQPGMENLRKSLLQAPIRFYRRLAQNIEHNGITDPSARARLGQAQVDLGEITNEIGMVADSITNFEQARENLEHVVREVPGAPEYRLLLARTRCFLANRYDKASRPEDARKAFDHALSDFEHLARAHPNDRNYRAQQAETLQLRADFLWDHGDLAESRRDYLASVAIGAALHLEYPADLEVMDKHASSLNNLSILYAEAGQREESMRTLAQSTVLRQKLVAITPADDPRRERFLSNLGSCYGNLGSGYLNIGDLDEAITWTRKALAIQDEQIKNHPNSVDYLERVGINHTVLGQLELRSGHLMTARRELERSRAHLEHLTRVRPGDAVFRMHLTTCLGSLADVESESSATAPALDLARRAASEAEDILRTNPKYHPAAQGLANQLLREAEISSDIGEPDRALANLDRAETILRQLVASYPEVTGYRIDLATTIGAHVRMESEIGRDQNAEARLREAATLAESVLRDDPNQVLNLASTAAICSDLGALLGRRRQTAEAQSLFDRALKLLEQARSRSPKDEGIRRTLVQTLVSHAEFLARLGKVQESLADLDLMRQTGLNLTYRGARRLIRTFAGHAFDSLRERPAFKLLMMDLTFPTQPFGRGPA